MNLTDMILNFEDDLPIQNFMAGVTLPDGFELPDNILVFMHDWFLRQSFLHSRHMLIIPAVPIEYRIDDNLYYRIEPGQAMYSPPFQNRSMLMTGSDMKHGYPRLLITFDLPGNIYYLPDNPPLTVTPEAEIFLSDLLAAGREKNNIDLSMRLFILLRELSRHQAAVPPVRHSPIVQAGLRYINNHTGQNTSLAAMAAEAKTSISNLRLLFKKEMGCSPGQFAAMHRLKVAQYNLAMTSLRVDEIARLCGFESVYAFSHFFKKHTGTSPLGWRKVNSRVDPPE